MPSRCDPTPISLAGGVLLERGAFNLMRYFLPIWSRFRCDVSLGFGISCVHPTAPLRGSLGAGSAEFLHGGFFNIKVDTGGGGATLMLRSAVGLWGIAPLLTGGGGTV